jgi:hypothetical protein
MYIIPGAPTVCLHTELDLDNRSHQLSQSKRRILIDTFWFLLQITQEYDLNKDCILSRILH